MRTAPSLLIRNSTENFEVCRGNIVIVDFSHWMFDYERKRLLALCSRWCTQEKVHKYHTAKKKIIYWSIGPRSLVVHGHTHGRHWGCRGFFFTTVRFLIVFPKKPPNEILLDWLYFIPLDTVWFDELSFYCALLFLSRTPGRKDLCPMVRCLRWDQGLKPGIPYFF